VTDREPELYTDEELKKFFNACGPRWPAEQIFFRTFLVTGFREDESRLIKSETFYGKSARTSSPPES
jgi:hypothetical protein